MIGKVDDSWVDKHRADREKGNAENGLGGSIVLERGLRVQWKVERTGFAGNRELSGGLSFMT
jgi:hypothetical protein